MDPPKSSRNHPRASFGAIQAVCTRSLTPFPMELQLEGKQQTPAGDRWLPPPSSWGPAPPRAELFPKEEKPTPWQRRGRIGSSMLWTMRAGKDSVNPSLDFHLRCVQQILRFHFIGVNHLYGAFRDLQESGQGTPRWEPNSALQGPQVWEDPATRGKATAAPAGVS